MIPHAKIWIWIWICFPHIGVPDDHCPLDPYLDLDLDEISSPNGSPESLTSIHLSDAVGQGDLLSCLMAPVVCGVNQAPNSTPNLILSFTHLNVQHRCQVGHKYVFDVLSTESVYTNTAAANQHHVEDKGHCSTYCYSHSHLFTFHRSTYCHSLCYSHIMMGGTAAMSHQPAIIMIPNPYLKGASSTLATGQALKERRRDCRTCLMSHENTAFSPSQ